jgi:hypothetical protein
MDFLTFYNTEVRDNLLYFAKQFKETTNSLASYLEQDDLESALKMLCELSRKHFNYVEKVKKEKAKKTSNQAAAKPEVKPLKSIDQPTDFKLGEQKT